MLYYSTNNQSTKVDFKEATINGQAPDKGLYFPDAIPQLSPDFIKAIKETSEEDIAYKVISPYVGNTMPGEELKRIVRETIDFPFPLVNVEDDIYALELYHGPTLAFKDVGARFMSRCLGYFLRNNDKKVTVLVATSGDTGGAVAHGFLNVEGVDVVILYPAGKVSKIQELQLTTPGNNTKAIEIDGSFDDCQAMVKKAFADEDLNREMFLTSANSINVARWLPQQFYYFFAYKQWYKNDPPVISVPSGNFGNICAGLLANYSGLPVKHFVAACNANDVVPHYLETAEYKPKQSVSTISNAMDVANPSNFVRILELFHHQFKDVKDKISSYSISDKDTQATLKDVYAKHKYLMDPHGAVGYLGLKKYLKENSINDQGIFLETAHPVKFYDVVEPVIKQEVPVPASIKSLIKKDKVSIKMSADYEDLKTLLLG